MATMTKATRALYDAAMTAPTQAACARILGSAGKTFRDVTRSRFGVYVSRDDGGAEIAWTTVRPYRVAYAFGDAAQRVTILQEWRDRAPLTVDVTA